MITGPPLCCWLRGPPSTRYAIGFVLSDKRGTPETPSAGPPTVSGPPRYTISVGNRERLSSVAVPLSPKAPLLARALVYRTPPPPSFESSPSALQATQPPLPAPQP